MKSKIMTFCSKLKFTFHFPFITYALPGYRVTGEEIREIMNIVQPGDILVRGFIGYLNKLLIPGKFTHVGMVMDDITKVVHAISPAVKIDDILTYCRCDYIAVVRVLTTDFYKDKRDSIISDAIANAYTHLGVPYDFDFNFSNNENMCCTELLANCFNVYREESGFSFSQYSTNPISSKAFSVIRPDSVIQGVNNSIVYISKYAEKRVEEVLNDKS